MGSKTISVEKIKEIWHSQVHDEQNWAANKKVLRALALFGGSIILMRNFGDAMAI